MGAFDDLLAKGGGAFADLDQVAAQHLDRTDKFMKGLRDPIDGGAQLLTKVLPDGVVQAGNKLNNWLADKTGMVGKLPEGGVDQQVRQQEAAYQKSRIAQGESGIDGYRMLGNVLNPANIAAAARLPAMATLPGRIAQGAAFSGISSAFNPIGEGDFTEEKLKQMGAGAAVGAAAPAVVNALSRLVSPAASTNPAVQLLRKEGVSPTIGQALGGRMNVLEEKLQSLPIMGDAIANARMNSLTGFNNAAINRAAGKVGEQVDGAGQTAVRDAGDAISATYNRALRSIPGVQFDNQFSQDVSQLRGMAQSLVPSMRDKFNSTYQDIIAGRMSRSGAMLPDTFKSVDSEIGNLASSYAKSTVASEKELGDALSQLQNLLRQQMVRSNPQVANDVSAANSGWANLVRVEGAAKAAKNNNGVFTPAQLNAAIQSADDSVRGRAVSRGTALMQDLANAGQQVIGNKVPNSFTTDRALVAGGGLASYMLNPMIPLGLVGGAAAYSKPVQGLLSAAVSARPNAAQPVADALNKYATGLLPLTSQVGLGLLEQY